MKELQEKVKAAQADPWTPLPATEEKVTQVQVAKINEDIADDEFEVELPHDDALAKLDCKSIKVKLEDKDGHELVGHYFDNKKLQSHSTGRMKIPAGFHLKNHKLIFAIKESQFMGMGEKNMFKTDVSLLGLGQSN